MSTHSTIPPKEFILGISPSIHMFGIAVMKKGELVDFRACRPVGKGSQFKCRRLMLFIKSCVTRYHVTKLVIKTTPNIKQSEFSKLLLSQIRQYAKENKMPVVEYSYEDIKEQYSDSAIKVTKRNLPKIVSSHFPELTGVYQQEERRWYYPYYIHLFEAVAVAHRLSTAQFTKA